MSFPLHLRSEGEFASARTMFLQNGYTEPRLCAYLAIPDLRQYNLDVALRPHEHPSADGFEALARLFAEGQFATSAEVALIGPGVETLLSDLGLIALDTTRPDHYYATMALVPTNGLLLVSDRWNNPDGTPYAVQSDIVYPGHIANTSMFLSTLPHEHYESVLDVGAGSGIAALLCAPFATKVIATDIAERSCQCAEFNSRLNGISNIEVRVGDLYEPAKGETFDLIVSHPPYVPSLKPTWVFHSGGEDGENISRRLVEGLPEMLRPGGRFYALYMATDRRGAPYQERARKFLGEHESEFDIALVERWTMAPKSLAERNALQAGGDTNNQVKLWRELFHRLEIEQLVYGSIVIQRHAAQRKTFTVRRPVGAELRWDHVAWMMNWETAAVSPGIHELVLDSALTGSRGTSLTVTHKIQGAEWAPERYQLSSQYPFPASCAGHPWMAALISAADGSRTARELFAQLQQQGVFPPNLPAHGFAQALLPMISSGILKTENFLPPPQSVDSGTTSQMESTL